MEIVLSPLPRKISNVYSVQSLYTLQLLLPWLLLGGLLMGLLSLRCCHWLSLGCCVAVLSWAPQEAKENPRSTNEPRTQWSSMDSTQFLCNLNLGNFLSFLAWDGGFFQASLSISFVFQKASGTGLPVYVLKQHWPAPLRGSITALCCFSEASLVSVWFSQSLRGVAPPLSLAALSESVSRLDVLSLGQWWGLGGISLSTMEVC